jgi:NAD-dependent SIR2 family protein deacetylase
MKISSPEEAGQILRSKKSIMILTGAGVSAASGIPTFRG